MLLGLNTQNRSFSKETIRDFPLFSELNNNELRQLIALSTLCRFKKSEVIFNQHDLYKGFYILLKGTVTASLIAETGHEAIVHILYPLSMFAEIPLFEGLNYPVTATCTEDSIAIFIPKDGFLELLAESPHLAMKMLAGLSKRTRELIHQIEIISTRDLKGRLAHYFLKEIKENGSNNEVEPCVILKFHYSTLATYLGIATETLSRTLAKLEKDNIIRLNKKTIYITNLQRLRELSEK